MNTEINEDHSKEINIVTAFFDIGRKDFSAIPRTNEKYFNNFKFWARIKNKLIVFTDTEMHKEKIYNIRKSFGLEEYTEIIIIEDLYSVELELYNNIKNVSKNEWFKDFRLLPNATSNIPEYSYLMLLKSWFLSEAVKRKLTSEIVAWIDFGFNHGGTLYIEPKDFSFKWEYPFSNKIHFFYYGSIDVKPIFETVRRLNDCIMGCLLVVPSQYCETLWELNKQSMEILNKVGLSDDDQLIQLMSYREKPDLFEMHKSDWFLPLKEFGGEHLRITTNKDKEKRLPHLRKLYLKFLITRKRKMIVKKYLKTTYKNLMNKDV